MVDNSEHAEAVTKSKRGVVTALLMLLLVVAGFAFAYAFLGGDDLVADLLGGDTAEPVVTVMPPKPKPNSTDTSTGAGSETPGTSIGTTGTTTPSTTTPGTTGSGGATTPAAKPPTGDQAARMYWEQVASQEQILKLVNGEVSSVAIGTVVKSGSTATVPLTVSYKAGGSLSGTMVLRNYSNVWYFSSIARSGNSLAVRTSKPGDAGIVSTIVARQAANQYVPLGIINGGYKTITIKSASMGSGTATIGITLSGGTSATSAGTITCVSKTINGEKTWFISSFAKK
ncbi:MAG: hypothetical protein Q8S43_05230 [Actinomycetota bacterium]|nr:hypothetical protein [Actinomycetota bacterium]